MLTLYKRGEVWWIKGHLPNGQPVPRQSTKQRDQAAAEKIRDYLVRTKTPSSPAFGLTINDALEQYLASQTIAERTAEHYRRVILALPAVYLSDITLTMLNDFVANLPIKSTSRRISRAKLGAFLRDAYRRGWIKEPIADRMAPVSTSHEQSKPFTHEETKTILAWRGRTGRWDQETFTLLMELMLRTGLRISDALQFDWRQVGADGVYRYRPEKQARSKPKRFHDVYVPPDLLERIGTRSFQYGASLYDMGIKAYRVMKRIPVEDCRPHRLRDTFAVRCLEAGLTLDDVSRLLGHSSVTITERYYAFWSRARRDGLMSRIAAI